MIEPEVLVDTSAAVAMVVTGHEAHHSTLELLEGRVLGLSGHAWFETFSVLTRLPPPARRSPADVLAILHHDFPGSRFLSQRETEELMSRLPGLAVAGGAVYDALVGQVAATQGLPLASRDRRAADLYRALGAVVEPIP